jgi:hypothetical protein
MSEVRRGALAGYLLILPSYLGFLIFVAGPVVAVFYYSLTNFDLLTPPEFIGLGNYERMLSDSRLHTTYANTIVYVIAAVTGITGLGLLLAVMLNRRLPRALRYIVRSAYFFPSLVGLVYVSIIFQALFQFDIGIINYYLGLIGISPIRWLNSAEGAVLSVIIVDVWRVRVAGSTAMNSAGPSFAAWIVNPAGSFVMLPTCGFRYVTVTERIGRSRPVPSAVMRAGPIPSATGPSGIASGVGRASGVEGWVLSPHAAPTSSRQAR